MRHRRRGGHLSSFKTILEQAVSEYVNLYDTSNFFSGDSRVNFSPGIGDEL